MGATIDWGSAGGIDDDLEGRRYSVAGVVVDPDLGLRQYPKEGETS